MEGPKAPKDPEKNRKIRRRNCRDFILYVRRRFLVQSSRIKEGGIFYTKMMED